MVTAREAFEAKLLKQKYGVIGAVAGRYRTAGYSVEVKSTSEEDAINFIAKKRGERLGVKVVISAGRVGVEVVERLAAKAKEEGLKPILVLYGAGPKVDSKVIEKANELGVSIRRVRG